MSDTITKQVRQFYRTRGEAFIVSGMVAFLISVAILQFPASINQFTVLLVLALWAYTGFTFAFSVIMEWVIE
jgi:sulfur transfer protein SufE